MTKPHKHAELIKAWADGAEIEGRQDSTLPWRVWREPAWNRDFEYRIKPAAPVVETKMTDDELESAYDAKNGKGWYCRVRAIANAAIARAIADGQVVACDHEVVVMGRESRAARDMAVAKAVGEALRARIGTYQVLFCDVELAAIIAKVK
jgi:hypothetical protein